MNEDQRNPTVVDIAREAGVSASTAAAAIRRSGLVKPATAEKVLSVAGRLGYRRNTAASVLASGRESRTPGTLEIGILGVDFDAKSPKVLPKELTELFGSQMADQWIFDFRPVYERRELNRTLREWAARGFDGLVLWRVYPDSMRFECPVEQFSVVATSHHRLEEGFDVIRCSHYFEQDRLLRRVRDQGYRRIGMVWRHHEPPTPEDKARLAAMLEFRDSQPPRDRLPVLRRFFALGSQWDKESKAFAKYVREYQPEVIVAFNISDLTILEASGSQVPRDVGFACLSCSPSDDGKIFGVLGEHLSSIPVLLAHLSRKIRARERGKSERPIEVVFRCPEISGETLPPRR